MKKSTMQGISVKLSVGFEAAQARFGQDDNVTAIEADTETNEIIVSVASATASEAVGMPEAIEGVPIRIREATYIAHDRSVSLRIAELGHRLGTLKSGASIAHHRSSAGTLGGFVVDNQNGAMMLLTNWHVAAEGGVPGDAILQPGPYDGGVHPNDQVATLSRSVIDKRGDAAVATLTGSRSFALDALASGIKIGGHRTVEVGDTLEKSGRTTGVTRGRVTRQGVYFITYSIGRVGVQGFRIEPLEKGNPDNIEISAPGDSGAFWYDPKTGAAVGLHFAGETTPLAADEHAIACNVDTVLKALDVRMASKAEVEAAAFGELAALSPELGGWAIAGLVIGASARLAGKQTVEEADLVTAFHEGVILARDHNFNVHLEALSREFISALAVAVGAKAAATIIGAAVGSKAVDGF
jgi:hypothetical protein